MARQQSHIGLHDHRLGHESRRFEFMFLSAYFFLGQLGVCVLSRLFSLRNGDGVLTLYLTLMSFLVSLVGDSDGVDWALALREKRSFVICWIT